MLVLFCACTQNHKASAGVIPQKHTAEIQKKGIGCIFLDRVSNAMILKENLGDSNSNRFVSIKVGFKDDNLIADRSVAKERGLYYQFGMEKDWVALVQNDSITPVFYQPLEQRMQQLHEGILVFEISQGRFPDTLCYKDALGIWGKQMVVFQ
jgi:hypothetical protein